MNVLLFVAGGATTLVSVALLRLFRSERSSSSSRLSSRKGANSILISRSIVLNDVYQPPQRQSPPFLREAEAGHAATGLEEEVQAAFNQWRGYDPAVLKLSGGLYGMMISAVIPRPIALVTTVGDSGKVNCAPFSYFSALSHDPPLVALGICINGRTKTKKDTLRNIEANGEYVVNIISAWYVESANHCCIPYPPDDNEMVHAGLTPIPSETVRPPRVGQAALQLECKVYDLRVIHNDEGEHTVTMVIGRIQKFHVLDQVLTADCDRDKKPIVDWAKLQPVGRMGGNDYTFVNNSYELARPDRKV